ncbi:MAG TPA: peptidoglycan-associated lipoprotein Pal [Steroidobacteraceae bacterium]
MRLMQAAVVAVLVLGLAACQKKQTKPDQVSTPAGGGVTTTGVEGSTGAEGTDTLTAQQQALAALKTRSIVYFTYDSSEIRPEYLEVVAAHAAFLAKYPNAKVRLEGHADERGSREYNIGLGERRAQAVRRALQLSGATEAQIATVSYGEERPAVPGGDEAAYAQNRRVEIVHAP